MSIRDKIQEMFDDDSPEREAYVEAFADLNKETITAQAAYKSIVAMMTEHNIEVSSDEDFDNAVTQISSSVFEKSELHLLALQRALALLHNPMFVAAYRGTCDEIEKALQFGQECAENGWVSQFVFAQIMKNAQYYERDFDLGITAKLIQSPVELGGSAGTIKYYDLTGALEGEDFTKKQALFTIFEEEYGKDPDRQLQDMVQTVSDIYGPVGEAAIYFTHVHGTIAQEQKDINENIEREKEDENYQTMREELLNVQ